MLVLYAFTMGLLVHVVWLLRRAVTLLGISDAPVSGFSLNWFLVTVCVAGLIATLVAWRLYWRYRLTPEKAAALDASYDRDEAMAVTMKLLSGAMIFMAVMFILFR